MNRYRYLQLRQRTLFPITPVHTFAEYAKFKKEINDRQFKKRNLKKTYPPHEAYKTVDFHRLTIAWNSAVDNQSRTETDSNKRLYYKLPSQLERHYKRTLNWKSECATILMGGNAESLKPFRDLLINENTTSTLPPSILPEIPAGLKDNCYGEEGEILY